MGEDGGGCGGLGAAGHTADGTAFGPCPMPTPRGCVAVAWKCHGHVGFVFLTVLSAFGAAATRLTCLPSWLHLTMCCCEGVSLCASRLLHSESSSHTRVRRFLGRECPHRGEAEHTARLWRGLRCCIPFLVFSVSVYGLCVHIYWGVCCLCRICVCGRVCICMSVTCLHSCLYVYLCVSVRACVYVCVLCVGVVHGCA